MSTHSYNPPCLQDVWPAKQTACMYCAWLWNWLIGETSRNLKARTDEHEDTSKQSEPARHLAAHPYHIFFWKPILSVHPWKRRSITEALLIAKHRPALRPRPHRDFFLRIRLPSTRNRRFRAPKTEVLKYAFRGGEFWKRRFIVFVWTGENGGFQIRWTHAYVQGSFFRTYDSKTLRVDADFYKYGEKNFVFKNTRIRVDGQIWFKNATCRRRFFLNTEKNLRFRKYPAMCGRGLNKQVQAVTQSLFPMGII